MTEGHDPRHPWLAYASGHHFGRYAARMTAIRAIDRERSWLKGSATVKHTGSGETWKRSRGAWFKTAKGKTRAELAAAARAQAPLGTVSAPATTAAGRRAGEDAAGRHPAERSSSPAPDGSALQELPASSRREAGAAAPHAVQGELALDLRVSSQNLPAETKP